MQHCRQDLRRLAGVSRQIRIYFKTEYYTSFIQRRLRDRPNEATATILIRNGANSDGLTSER